MRPGNDDCAGRLAIHSLGRQQLSGLSLVNSQRRRRRPCERPAFVDLGRSRGLSHSIGVVRTGGDGSCVAGAELRVVFPITPAEAVNCPVSPAKTGYVDSRSRRSSGDVAGDESPYDMLRACSSSCAMTASSREVGVEN